MFTLNLLDTPKKTFAPQNSNDYQRVSQKFQSFVKNNNTLKKAIQASFDKEDGFSPKDLPIFFEIFTSNYAWQVGQHTLDFFKGAMQQNNAVHLVNCLIDLGYKPNLIDQDGKTVLHLAAKVSQLHIQDVIKLLVKHVNINTTNNNGRTPLISAVKSFCNENNNSLGQEQVLGNLFAIEALLDLGANKLLKDNKGHTALDHALLIAEANPNNPFAIDMITLLDPGMADIFLRQQLEIEADQARSQRQQAEMRFGL
jgi:ankyrin repeat protein